MEGKPYQVPVEINRKAISLPSEILKRYTGIYDFAEANHTRLAFKVQDRHLVLFQDDKKLSTLFAQSEKVFFEDPKATTLFEFIPHGNKWDLVWTYQGIKLKGLKLEVAQ